MPAIQERHRYLTPDQNRQAASAESQDAIRAAIEELLSWCREVEQLGAPRLNELGVRLRRLRFLLAAHFAEEERECPFDEAIRVRPELACEAAALLSEHGEFLDRLEQLSEQLCCVRPEIDRWSVAIGALQSVLLDLQQHERREAALLRTAGPQSAQDLG